MNKTKLGSKTAKGGFANEKAIDGIYISPKGSYILEKSQCKEKMELQTQQRYNSR